MKTLVAGAVAALLGSATLLSSAATPAAADPPAPPTVTTSCKVITIQVDGTYEGTGYVVAFGYGFADNGEPEIVPDPAYQHSAWLALDLSKSYRWHLRMSGPDGTVVSDQSGTTTACAPVLLGHAQPVRPPVPPCGSTLDDVAWPSTPGIVYSHDQWNGYARLQPGWEWVNSSFDPITGWWLSPGSSIEVELAWLPRQEILDPTGHCGAYKAPPMDTEVSGPCWKGAADPKPCPTPQTFHDDPSHPSGATPTKVPAAPTSAPRQPTAPSPTGAPPVAVATTAPPARPTPVATVASPTPVPSPSSTAAAQATPRVATTTGLGVAGGVTGACVLAAAGAFVVRRRLRPTTDGVLLDEVAADDDSTD